MDNRTPSPYVITIGRQYGSNGRRFGQDIAKQLGIAYYDKVILSQAAEDTGLGRNVFQHASTYKGFIRQFIGAVQPFIGGDDFYGPQLTEENRFSLQSAIIQRLAAERSCVIVGRAADHILKAHPHRTSLFITADMPDRIRRVMDEKKVDLKTAQRHIKQTDNKRAGYYNFHTNNNWGSAEAYDLCINISTLGYDKTLDLIVNFIRQHQQLPADQGASETTPPIPEVF